MEITIYINTLFSVDCRPTDPAKGKILQTPPDDLFKPDRILSRLITFRDLCIKSVINQTYKHICHRVFISDNIPENVLFLLKSIIKQSIRTELVCVNKNDLQMLNKYTRVNEEGYKIIMNLDDDDYLAPWYCETLVNSLPSPYTECFLTMPWGLQITWQGLDNIPSCESLDSIADIFAKVPKLNTISVCSKRFYPSNNMGMSILTKYSKSTLEFGNHCFFSKHHPVLEFGSSRPGWLRTFNHICKHDSLYRVNTNIHTKPNSTIISNEDGAKLLVDDLIYF